MCHHNPNHILHPCTDLEELNFKTPCLLHPNDYVSNFELVNQSQHCHIHQSHCELKHWN